MIVPGLLVAMCDACGAGTCEFIDPNDPEHVTCKGCGAKCLPIIGPGTMMDVKFWIGSKSKGLLGKGRISFEPQHSRDGALAKVERYFQQPRHGNRYSEKVTLCETEEVIHECDEPLTDHRGHGSAKR
jgi:hypothetical protein